MAPGDAFAPLIRNTPKGPPPPADLTQPPDVFSAPQHGPTCRPQGFSGEAEEKNVAKFVKKWRAAGHIVAELKPKCSARLVIRRLQRKRVYLAGGGGGVGPQGEGMRLAVDKPADALANRAHRPYRHPNRYQRFHVVASSEVLPVTRVRPAGVHLGQETVVF